MKRLTQTTFLLSLLLLLAACSTSEPSPPPATMTLSTIDPLQFSLVREDDTYELVATCVSEGRFAEILLNVQTTNTSNNSSYQAAESADSDVCTTDSATIFSSSLFTVADLVPGESINICVTVTIPDGAATDCRPVVVRDDGYIELETP